MNGVNVATERELLRDENGLGYASQVRVTCQGSFIAETASNQTELAAKQALLNAALVGTYPDVVFRMDNGGVAIQMLNAGSTTGVQVVKGPDFPGGGSEFATTRTFSFVLEAQYPLRRGDSVPISFSESFSFWGGGPRRTLVEAVNDYPQPQTLALATAFMATQQGQAKMSGIWPPPQPPLFPSALLEAPRVTYSGPVRKGRGLSDFAVEWAYSFGSVTPLNGRPAIPPG